MDKLPIIIYLNFFIKGGLKAHPDQFTNFILLTCNIEKSKTATRAVFCSHNVHQGVNRGVELKTYSTSDHFLVTLVLLYFLPIGTSSQRTVGNVVHRCCQRGSHWAAGTTCQRYRDFITHKTLAPHLTRSVLCSSE